VEDVKHAIRWLKVYGQSEGLIDGDRIVAYGTSSGGHLAAFAAATPGLFEPEDLTPAEASVDSTLAGAVSVVGPTDLVEFYDVAHPWARPLTEAFLACSPCTEQQLAEASPVSYLHPGLPPAYWVYGELDSLVPADTQGAAIAAAWGEHAGTFSSWLDLVDGAGHNIDHTTINQRFVELFVDFAAGPP
jgi:acetyl esterase/lipase